MSASRKGVKQSPEGLAKRVAALRTPEAKANMSAAQTGRKHSPETRAKIKAANIKHLYLVTSPEGEEFQVSDLVSFCQERGLNHPTLCSVVRGDRAHHRKWKAKRIS